MCAFEINKENFNFPSKSDNFTLSQGSTRCSSDLNTVLQFAMVLKLHQFHISNLSVHYKDKSLQTESSNLSHKELQEHYTEATPSVTAIILTQQ